MKKRVSLVVVVAIIATALFAYMKSAPMAPPAVHPDSRSQNSIEINGHVIAIEIVDTDAAREKGLSGRDSLAQGTGMLFVFPEDDAYAFWMKDMHFAIDILWISADGHVVDMRENVSPDTYPTTFIPQSPARYVLELPAHTVKGLEVDIGDIVRL